MFRCRRSRIRMLGPALVHDAPDTRPEQLVCEPWRDPLGAGGSLHAVRPDDDHMSPGRSLPRDRHGGDADVRVEHDDVRIHVLREDAAQLDLVRSASDDVEALRLEQVVKRTRRIRFGEHHMDERRGCVETSVVTLLMRIFHAGTPESVVRSHQS